MVMKNVTKKIQKIPYLFLLMLFSFVTASAQKGITVRGTVLDSNGETIIGASVTLKGNNSVGTISDIDGNFVLTVPVRSRPYCFVCRNETTGSESIFQRDDKSDVGR
jgi:hypothetical protein